MEKLKIDERKVEASVFAAFIFYFYEQHLLTDDEFQTIRKKLEQEDIYLDKRSGPMNVYD